MGVPIETALRWEQKREYDIPRFYFPSALRECVTWHFVRLRTKEWDARLKEYWDPNEDDIQNNEKYRDYMHLGTTRGCSWEKLRFYNDDVLRPPGLPIMRPGDQLRETVEKCNRMRCDFHGFMYLPSEIRDMIYSFALCRGKVIVPNSRPGMGFEAQEAVERYQSPNGHHYRRYEGLKGELLAMNCGRYTRIPLGLIQGVSRAVHDEAARIYFGRNQFIFPAGFFMRPRYCNMRTPYEGEARDGLSSSLQRDIDNQINNAPLLRDVSYTFDMRDHPTDDYENLYTNYSIKEHVDSRTLSRSEALQALHDEKAHALEFDWAERIDRIKHMKLDRLVLDFEECYCAIGCCRKVEWVVDRLIHKGPPPGTADTEDNAYSSYDWVNRPPLMVEVMGFVDDREQLEAMAKLRRLIGSVIRPVKTDDVLNDAGRRLQEVVLND
ncbi:hypothetical protein DHEL01_v207124 [Diaporthe helianthi]|uniref:Uncharacterized protein n=1 Tax=Diaporthe helianthi TaxID=158607 RepID=A0A2P5HW42_DIAHE|nr:hypothetical protein DHEL01_v207124 [Diaporthe helianthi]